MAINMSVPNPFRTTVASITSQFSKLVKQLNDVVANAETDMDTMAEVIAVATNKRNAAYDEKVKALHVIKNINKLIGE